MINLGGSAQVWWGAVHLSVERALLVVLVLRTEVRRDGAKLRVLLAGDLNVGEHLLAVGVVASVHQDKQLVEVLGLRHTRAERVSGGTRHARVASVLSRCRACVGHGCGAPE